MKYPSTSSSKNEAPLILLEKITKRYNRQVVLSIEEFKIKPGDAVLIYGQNGGGKSTLIRILAGIIPITSGKITRSKEIRKQNIVYIPQNGGLYRNLTVMENLQIWGRLYHVDVAPDLSGKWYVEKLGLGRFLQHRVSELSGGFYKIAAIACGLSVQPKGLFIDEPFSGIDENRAELLSQGLERLKSELDFMLLTSHQPAESSFITEHVHLAHGEIALA